jgi:hypothetical protein
LQLNTEQKEVLKESFAPKTESATKLPNVKSVGDNADFILVESGIRTPHKMINGKWHRMVVDVNSIIRYEEV